MYMIPSHDVSDKINQNLFTVVKNVFIKTWTFKRKCQTLVMQVNNNTLNRIVLQGTIFMLWNGNVISISIYTRTITSQANRSAKHTNWPVHVRRDGFSLLADFEVPEPFSRRLLYGWKSLLLSSINCWAWEEPTELVEATFVRLSPSANCLQFSLRRTRSPKVSTPRRIRQLSDIARITCGSIFSSANLLESVESPTLKDRLHFVSKWRDQRKRGSLETNIPAMHCGYIIRKFADQTFCTAHNIAAGVQCCVKVARLDFLGRIPPKFEH